MAKKLFVGGLSWETTDSDLTEGFCAIWGDHRSQSYHGP